MAQLPELSYDDVADVIATGIRDRSDRWRPHNTRAYGLGAAGAALAVGAVTIALSGPPWIAAAVAAGIVALLLLIGAFALSRAYGDSGAGAVFGYAALPYGFLAGLLAPAGRGVGLDGLGAPHLLAGFGAAALVAVIAGFVVADGLQNFIGVALAALIGVIAALVAFLAPSLPGSGIGGAAVAITLPMAALVPTLAFRLSRLPLPAVPTSAEDLMRDNTNLDGASVLQRTGLADKYATGLVAGIALVGAAGVLALAGADGWAAPATIGAISISLLLRSRVFRGRVQRALMLVAGMFGVAVLAVWLASHAGQIATLLAVLVPLVVAAALAAGISVWLPANRPTPFWGRLGDILDVVVIILIFPLAGYALNLFSEIRGLGG